MAHLSALLNPSPTSSAPTTFSPLPPSPPSFAMPNSYHHTPHGAQSPPSSLSPSMFLPCNHATSNAPRRFLTNADVIAASSPPSSPSPSISRLPNRATSKRHTAEADANVATSSPTPPSSPSRSISLLRNRATSARHRTKADAIFAGAEAEVDALAALRPALTKLTASLLTPTKIVLDNGLLTTTPDYLLNNYWDEVVNLSRDTATVLRTAVITRPVAVALLEIIGLRRGIVTNPLDLSAVENRRETVSQYNCIMAKLAEDDITGARVPEDICEARLNELVALWSRWSAFEGRAPWFLQAKYAVVEDALAEAASDVSRHKPAGKRERRRFTKHKCCRRCGVPKTAGSGHRRSICPDGMHVGSGQPYLYSPGW